MKWAYRRQNISPLKSTALQRLHRVKRSKTDKEQNRWSCTVRLGTTNGIEESLSCAGIQRGSVALNDNKWLT
ncbi:hypothetical protein F2Q68_00025755 [Brassica cretica]|uniref:Uncharacterized protein n=2 Tax=Brassica cretica TaxID=69181 RepID=A0A8S9IH46_BRACR|nr:hypothetical protein F2Q68_00025755 [Brassica cretica]KAF3576121.1 hypothetical protein DY000_02031715 [Brassica cretica]